MAEKYKLILVFNVRNDSIFELQTFLFEKFWIKMGELGADLTGFWWTMYGNHPDFMLHFEAQDLPTLDSLLASDWYLELEDELQDYACDLNRKLVKSKKSFQFIQPH